MSNLITKNDIPTIQLSEMTMVENNALSINQIKFIIKKTPRKYVKKRPGKGGENWDYVSGAYIKKVLNITFGWDWDFHVLSHNFDLNLKQAYVLGRLKVRTNGREIVKEQFGRVEIKFKKSDGLPLDIGNDLKAASTDALKKCASELGICADIYAPEEFKEISLIDNSPLDPEAERIKILIEGINSHDDLEFAQQFLTHEKMTPELEKIYKQKVKELNKNQ